ncbi:hypothetical protein SDC9_212589 [bioreactor metagenome]|uniref:Uncharacterized protein n=1 Tax=bioreactor metagenome TaxID=1076179 RepID=A0A645JNE9_9ZZZZ
MLDHAKVSGIQNIRSPLILFDGEIFPRPLLFHQMVFPTTGMGAFSPVCIPLDHKVAQQAASGIGNAHGALNKRFQLQGFRQSAPQFPDLGKGKFPGQHDPLYSLLVPEFRGFVIGHVGLGGEMDLRARNRFTDHHDNTRIRHDKGVDGDFRKLV